MTQFAYLKLFLNTSIQSDDNKIKIDKYNLIRSDHSNDWRKDEVCIYYKQNITLIKHDDIFALKNCLVTEIYS